MSEWILRLLSFLRIVLRLLSHVRMDFKIVVISQNSFETIFIYLNPIKTDYFSDNLETYEIELMNTSNCSAFLATDKPSIVLIMTFSSSRPSRSSSILGNKCYIYQL